VSTNSGTDALHIAQLAAGIGPNRRVVTSPASFIATANAIIHANNLPVFSDINLENYTLDSEMLSKAVAFVWHALVSFLSFNMAESQTWRWNINRKRKLLIFWRGGWFCGVSV
jgi:dTDP-4-amino-4,6-dideoxygalactose transaminase